MAVIEAQAAGVPVVASRVGGVTDLIEDGVTGLFCDPSSADSMRNTVERLLCNKDLARRLSEKARERALEKYQPRIIAARHLEIYREVLNSKTAFPV